jgi:hypothetical protein
MKEEQEVMGEGEEDGFGWDGMSWVVTNAPLW